MMRDVCPATAVACGQRCLGGLLVRISSER